MLKINIQLFSNLDTKKGLNKNPLIFKNGVDEVTILEPNDSEIVSRNINSDNIYCRLVHIMKQSTQEYYNIRMVLGLEVA